MRHLRDEELAEFAMALAKERRRLEASLNDPDGLQAGEDPGDLQDAAADQASRTQASMLTRRAQNRLLEVLAALARIDAGTYGICEDSGEPIPARRLALDPTIRHTVEAQEELERTTSDTNSGEDEAY